MGVRYIIKAFLNTPITCDPLIQANAAIQAKVREGSWKGKLSHSSPPMSGYSLCVVVVVKWVGPYHAEMNRHSGVRDGEGM